MKVLVLGSGGLCGYAIKTISSKYNNYKFIFHNREKKPSSKGDLTCEAEVISLYEQVKPDYVINLAATVGGILFNMSEPARLFFDNMLINLYVTYYAHVYNVKKLISFGSMCSFPDELECFTEENLHFGPPHPVHGSYAYSKRMIDIYNAACNKQYNTNFMSVIPSNIYGCNDWYDLNFSHVIPGILHRTYLSKQKNEDLICWGDGVAKRDFIFSEDVANIVIRLLSMNTPEKLIICTGKEVSIKAAVELICKYFDFKKNIIWNTNMPSGQLRRPVDNSRFRSLFPDFKFTSLENGIEKSVRWFEEKYPNIRGF